MSRAARTRLVAVVLLVLCPNLAYGREPCEGGGIRAWSSTLPGGALVAWQMRRDLGGCRHVKAAIPSFPTDVAAAARTLAELAEALTLVGSDFSRDDLVGFCVAALAGKHTSHQKRFHGRWNSARCKVVDASVTITLHVDTI